jgi:hypothetical protein
MKESPQVKREFFSGILINGQGAVRQVDSQARSTVFLKRANFL